ncbi:MAG TPA: NADPH-dependent FMN reductase [Caulobacteraceae bacterium]|nr:NADPH-dependent FMN reductase [Caulobacteraceae bacterium]
MTQTEKRPLVVGLGGTVRPESSSERALKKSLAAAEAAGARTRLFDGAFMSRLPIYNPAEPDHGVAAEFLAAVSEADGFIVASPGYHGSISGLVKNALDTLEGLRDDARPYFDGRAVGLIVAADGWQACGSTMAALRGIIHAMRGWPTPLGAALNSGLGLFDAEGDFRERRDAWQVETVAQQVVEFARRWAE